MSRYLGFLAPGEIDTIVADLCTKGNLVAVTSKLVSEKPKREILIKTGFDDLANKTKESIHLYLVPAAVWGQAGRPSINKIDLDQAMTIWVGQFTSSPESVLTSTYFYGRDNPATGYLGSRLRRTLRRYDWITFGLVGRNFEIGGEAVYKNDFYSDAAEQLRLSGTLWKQLVASLVDFYPYKEPSEDKPST